MVKLKQALVVEGRYDKNTLSQIVDAPIFVTNGFGIFKDKEAMALLRAVAHRRGLIVFTDADGAGLVIRNYLKSAIPPQDLLHAYIPDVPGKERRKAAPGKEGKLGVEGMSPEILLTALRHAGADFLEGEMHAQPPQPITKQDLFDLGLSGGPESKARRQALQAQLGLPINLSANALLQTLNCLYTTDEFRKAMETL